MSNVAQTFIKAPRRENLDSIPSKLEDRNPSPHDQSQRKTRKSLEDELFGAKMERLSPNQEATHPFQQKSNPVPGANQNISSSMNPQPNLRQHPLDIDRPEAANKPTPYQGNRAPLNEPKQKYNPLPPDRSLKGEKDALVKPNVHDTLENQVDKMNNPNSSLRSSKGFPRSNYKTPHQQAPQKEQQIRDTQDYLKPFKETSNIQPLDRPIDKYQKAPSQDQPSIPGAMNTTPVIKHQSSEPHHQRRQQPNQNMPATQFEQVRPTEFPKIDASQLEPEKPSSQDKTQTQMPPAQNTAQQYVPINNVTEQQANITLQPQYQQNPVQQNVRNPLPQQNPYKYEPEQQINRTPQQQYKPNPIQQNITDPSGWQQQQQQPLYEHQPEQRANKTSQQQYYPNSDLKQQHAPLKNLEYEQNNPNSGAQQPKPISNHAQATLQRTLPSSRGSTLGGAEEGEQENFEFGSQEINQTVAQTRSNAVTQTMVKSGTKKKR